MEEYRLCRNARHMAPASPPWFLKEPKVVLYLSLLVVNKKFQSVYCNKHDTLNIMQPFREWYDVLVKPSWTPAPGVIGTIWSILYPIIAITHGFVIIKAIQGKLSWLIALPFILNLVFNIVFTPIQFGLRNLPLASVDIILVWVTIVWGMIVIWPEARWVTYAMIPYFVWVSIASVLQIFLTIKN